MNRTYVKQLLTSIIGDGYSLCSRLESDMMNVSYLVKDKKGKMYVLALPNGKTNKIIDRKSQQQCHDVIAKLNITNKDIYFDTTKGIRLSEYIEGTTINNVEEIDYDALALVLHKLHNASELLDNDYNPFDRLAYYENRALKFRAESNYYRILRDYVTSHVIELESGYKKCVCHNNIQNHNIVKGDDGAYYLINFEFAANNDPLFDIASFAINDLEKAETLLSAYCNIVDDNIKTRFYLWRILISLQWHVTLIAKHYQNESRNTGKNFLLIADQYLKNAIRAYNKVIKIK